MVANPTLRFASSGPVADVGALLPSAIISVNVPALIFSDSATVTASVAGTELDGITVGDAITVNPPDMGSGPGVGGYVSCRVTALNTIELKFFGETVGGLADFIVTALT